MQMRVMSVTSSASTVNAAFSEALLPGWVYITVWGIAPGRPPQYVQKFHRSQLCGASPVELQNRFMAQSRQEGRDFTDVVTVYSLDGSRQPPPLWEFAAIWCWSNYNPRWRPIRTYVRFLMVHGEGDPNPTETVDKGLFSAKTMVASVEGASHTRVVYSMAVPEDGWGFPPLFG